MRAPRSILAGVVVVTLGAGMGWARLAGYDGPVEPDLGPVVRVRLMSPTSPASTGPPAPGAVTAGDPPEHRAAPHAGGAPTSGAATPGARTVPRHPPAPAGDDDDDNDDNDDRGDQRSVDDDD